MRVWLIVVWFAASCQFNGATSSGATDGATIDGMTLDGTADDGAVDDALTNANGLISINVGHNGPLDPSEPSGIQGVTNWNDLTGIANATTSDLVDSLGAPATGMTFAITGGNDSFNHLSTPDKRMISGWVRDATVNITGIPYSTYDVIIYYDSWAQVSNQNNSIAEYAFSSGGGAITSVWGVNQKDFRLGPEDPHDYDEFMATSLAEAQAQGTGSDSGDGDGGYHLIVTGLTASELDIVATTVEGTPASICAIQIRGAAN